MIEKFEKFSTNYTKKLVFVIEYYKTLEKHVAIKRILGNF